MDCKRENGKNEFVLALAVIVNLNSIGESYSVFQLFILLMFSTQNV